MTRGRAAAALCFSAAIALFAAGARAEGPEPSAVESSERSRIVILCAEGDPFGMRLAAELAELGFDALLVVPEGEASRASLEASARKAGAIAAIRAVPSGSGVEVWIADRVTGKTLLREMAVSGDDPDSALVLRTVELLRASLLEIALPEAPPGEVPNQEEIARKLDVSPPGALADRRPLPLEPLPLVTFRFALAPGVLLSPGGLGPIPTLGAGVDWRLSDNAGVAALATMPITSARIERPEGAVSLSIWTAGAAVRLFFSEPRRRWAPSIDVGALALFLENRGQAIMGYVARRSSTWTAAPFARVGLAYSVAPPVRLRADVMASALIQGVSIRVADREAATWGAPFVLFSLGADVGWF